MAMTNDEALVDVAVGLQMTTAMLVALIENTPHKDVLATRFAEIERAFIVHPEGKGPLSSTIRIALRRALGMP